jgi:hypothetical protein
LLQGNIVLCGLRNGAILTVDVREKQERVSDRFIRRRIPYSSLGRQGPSSSKQWFEVLKPLDMINFAGTKFVAKLFPE